MRSGNDPCRVLLVGGGHCHALVLRALADRPLDGAEITLLNPGRAAAYSGMLPGHVAGHYSRAMLDIDLAALVRAAGATLVIGRALSLDPVARRVACEDGISLPFDLCAIDVGISSDMPRIPGFADHAVPVKPLGPFADRWRDWCAAGAQGPVVVLGGGVAGIELALAMGHALRARPGVPDVTVLDRSRALSEVGARTRARLLAALDRQGTRLREHCEVANISAEAVTLTSGETVPAQLTIGAAGAAPQDWLAKTGLEHENGFLRIAPTLQTSDPRIFATGDCAAMTESPRPKAGVFAVRQAPVLLDNLRRTLAGQALARYHPQADYLKLISMGERRAIGQRFGLTLDGAWVWRWKDRIDRRFMARLSPK
ncbi:FAD-dependent oxidoreductase [Poseidonocella sedimentorum]|uniref:Pyridine nucleotide-disulfide oxidoreductase family protein n=1 Tax=Poseidonocella sedimentorum TaxID=871652 RepID=A0A1I6D3W0_9RHOB|nr:FAD-dependent oxidoreductase [Poseidonocella sedimentorum]SFR00007.1 pyridine nucleotide-disulfide oxidoreductase family protein [Poseidonocella sedimentorum]